MPLESLENNQINIHDLTLEQEKKPIPESKKLYDALKETPLFDIKTELWNASLHENQILENSNRCSMDQLLGILVENKFNKKHALELYEKIKQTPLFDSDEEEWKYFMDEDQTIWNNETSSADQLTGILVEPLFNEKHALELYEKLKTTPLYQSETGRWYAYMNREENNSLNRTIRTEVQLMGILVEMLFDKERAQKQFEYYKKQDVLAENYKTEIKLLHVLVNAQFDKTQAQTLYQSLKKTGAYDPDFSQWKYDSNSTTRYIKDQLIGILCEQEFEEELEPNLQTPTPSLPETRSY